MKILKSFIAVTLIALIVTACTVPQVVSNPDGTTSTNQVVDPKLTNSLSVAQGVNTATAPLNPFSGLIDLGLGLTTAVASFIAAKKNSDAAKQKKAADALAEAIVNLGSAAMDHATKVAGANGAAAVVAEHLDNNSGVKPTET